ncbi:MAG: rhomboid family intramembrane serine protease [Acidobacteria bacterium]|nr:rhomboid family intramembrane serine protease [Acidobacteriota bacterium]MBV9479330.1 rhomboid family intramembrane serine protease [Acidobacteriota bacterium]
MYRGRTLSLSFPPFTPWVKRIIIACALIFLAEEVLGAVAPASRLFLIHFFGLVPVFVVHGMLWQLVSYSFLHAGLMHLLVNMLTLWMFGSQQEQDWGSKQFLEFYLFSVIGSALVTILVAYSPLPGVTPGTATIGASGGIYGLLIAFGMLYGDREVFMFPLPFMMKAKYMVAIIIFVVIVATFEPSQGGIANFAHLGGLLFGFIYIKFLPRQGLLYGLSEHYFRLRNEYYRGKRRRAARKFEVYMRQHGDVPGRFDEYGNYIPPDDKQDGKSKSGWVN